MCARKLSLLFVAAFVLGVSPASSSARATCLSPSPERAPWFGGGSAERWTPERAHVFLAGGYAAAATKSLVNAWWLDGWTATAGVELPVSRSWALVPRLHLSNTSGENSGDVLWARLAVDGRLSSTRGGLLSYQEAGIGMGVLDYRVTVSDADFDPRYERRSAGTPFFQVVAGLRGDPEQAPAFITEVIVVFGLGAERPGGFELVAGVEF